MPGIGPHPKGIHHWWARLPLPTARAVLFASVVDDPCEHPEMWPTEEAQNAERERLFDIIRTDDGQEAARASGGVRRSARARCSSTATASCRPSSTPSRVVGSIPLEANGLGFEAHAGDLNPVAVLLNKCNLEIAPRWAGSPPVNPEDRRQIGGTRELARHARACGGRALLRPADSRRGAREDRPPLPEGAPAEGARRRRGERDRMDLGAHSGEPEPSLRAGGCSTRINVHALHQDGQGGLASSR